MLILIRVLFIWLLLILLFMLFLGELPMHRLQHLLYNVLVDFIGLFTHCIFFFVLRVTHSHFLTLLLPHPFHILLTIFIYPLQKLFNIVITPGDDLIINVREWGSDFIIDIILFFLKIVLFANLLKSWRANRNPILIKTWLCNSMIRLFLAGYFVIV